MIISYFNKEKIIKSKKTISFKKIAKNAGQEATTLCESKNLSCELFQQTKTKLLKKSIELYCIYEQLRHFKHDARQPLSVVGLVAHDLEYCLEYGELDTESLAQNAQSLHNQVQRLDSMLGAIAQQEAQRSKAQGAQRIELAHIVQALADDFADSLSVELEESAHLIGQPELVACIFYAFFEMFGQSGAQIAIAQDGAQFVCANAQNLPSATLQTLLDAHNKMARTEGIDSFFEFITTADGGSLFFSRSSRTKLAKLT